MNPSCRYTIFMLLKTTPAWLALSRPHRNEIAQSVFEKALQGDEIRLRHFDAEAFTARCTDIAVFDTDNLQAYYFAVECIRDSALMTIPYFEIIDIIPAIENGFRMFEMTKLATHVTA